MFQPIAFGSLLGSPRVVPFDFRCLSAVLSCCSFAGVLFMFIRFSFGPVFYFLPSLSFYWHDWCEGNDGFDGCDGQDGCDGDDGHEGTTGERGVRRV